MQGELAPPAKYENTKCDSHPSLGINTLAKFSTQLTWTPMTFAETLPTIQHLQEVFSPRNCVQKPGGSTRRETSNFCLAPTQLYSKQSEKKTSKSLDRTKRSEH